MKAVFRKGKDVFLKDIKLPALKSGQIRLKVEACGVCGTDVHSSAEQEEQFGHEIAGTILETGVEVPDLSVGQKVVLDSATPCGRCDNCKNTEQELCTNIQSIWFVPSFGFAEEMIAPAICAIPYEGMSPEIASLQEPLGVAIDLVRLSEINTDSNVLIMGQGPIGLMATALAKRAGARKIFVSELEARSKRIELAKKFGADICLDPSKTPLDTCDFGCKINRILVTAPPKLLNSAFKIASKGAIISFIGIAFGESANVAFDANEFHFKKLQLRASFASPALYGPRAIQYLKEGVIDGDAIVTHRYKLGQIKEALQVSLADSSAVKVVIVP
jgi:threonine dehydrogenase-like Zn-dependent dehydrogenase